MPEYMVGVVVREYRELHIGAGNEDEAKQLAEQVVSGLDEIDEDAVIEAYHIEEEINAN